jgi:hypothetical protein
VFVKTKQLGGRTVFYLCIGEQGGNDAGSWKTVEYSLCLGETLNLSSDEWLELIGESREFRSVALEDILHVVEKYAEDRGFDSRTLAGLREAVRGPREKSRRGGRSGRRSQEDEYTAALKLLGLPPGSTNREVESAFKKAARRYHPDVGGDAARFRALVDARNLLLTREWRASRIV